MVFFKSTDNEKPSTETSDGSTAETSDDATTEASTPHPDDPSTNTSLESRHVPVIMQAPVQPNSRLEFLNTKPPPNYVAGLGRGATGFTTRSDIGPVRVAPAATVGVGRGRGKGPGGEEENGKGYDNEKFEGNDTGLLSASAKYDEEDEEWDAELAKIEERMDRRKERREARLKRKIEEYRASNPTITEQFADLERKLRACSGHPS